MTWTGLESGFVALLAILASQCQTAPVWHCNQCLALWLKRAVMCFVPILKNASMTIPAATPVALMEQIARQHLCIETLKTRNSDSLDFHDVSVANVSAALAAAYQAGLAANKPS